MKKTLIYLLLTFLAIVILGTVLLFAVYLTPNNKVQNNISVAHDMLKKEGDYPTLISGQQATQLDNYTDSIILSELMYEDKDSSFIEKAMKVYKVRYDDSTPTESLVKLIENSKAEHQVTSYERYWHGYLVIYKPLLSLFSYSNFKVVNGFLQLLLMGVVIILMVKRNLTNFIFPFVFSIFMISPFTISLSMQFSSVIYICLLGVIFLLKFNSFFMDKFGEKYLLFYFLIIGMLTSYFDFLTYPLATLGVPLTFALLLNKKDFKWMIKKIIILGIIWCIGYGGMWISKWLISSLLLNENVFATALKQAQFRVSNEGFSRLDAIGKNLSIYSNMAYFLILITVVIYYIFRIRKTKITHIKKRFLQMLPFIIIALMPICWYFCLSNHSYLHYWFTYRELVILFLALLVSLEVFLFKERCEE